MLKEDIDRAFEGCTTRTHLVVALARVFRYRSYLEIGCRKNETFSAVPCERKVGVDPLEGGTVRLTSDEFFYHNLEKFDLVFIDGDHHHDQVLRDAQNALNCLELGGAVVLHDCNPPDASHEGRPGWKCGTAWRAFAVLRQQPHLDMVTADWDYGSGIIRLGRNTDPVDQKTPIDMERLTYFDFQKHRNDWMKVTDHRGIVDWVEHRAPPGRLT